ncbi:outer membrane protein [Mesorhizobium sp. B3-1-9]|uniref:outer membrane protein n=1 Tax=Mesorhizobium sp. B3-1-9 TaxID=2589892 RepID=UPI0015E36FC4|nr:outer membrane protein [Mesorhizobium sp. B3-1-9]
MTRLFWSLVSFLLGIAFTSGALAGDLVKPGTYDWSGFYVGVNAGYSFVSVKPIYGDEDFASKHSDGLTGGAQIGANWQVDRIVLGIEADLQKSNARGTAVLDLAPSEQTIDVKLDWFATIRARVGYLMTDRALIYATAGPAMVRAKTTIYTNFINTEMGLAGQSTHVESENRSGWSIGAGGEFALADNWSLKAEYLYADLGSKSHYYLDPVGNGAFLQNQTGGAVKFQTVRMGLNYRF